MSNKTYEDAEPIEVTELEDNDLDSVSGGAEANNCTNNCYGGNCSSGCGGGGGGGATNTACGVA